MIAPEESGSADSFWVRIEGATTNTNNHSSGWVRWNNFTRSSTWVWDAVHSSEDANAEVEFTLPPGNHVLEFRRREDGAQLDGILITDDLNTDPASLPDDLPETNFDQASQPNPSDGATDVLYDGTVLSWSAGTSAAAHSVYFGETFEDVNTATRSSPGFKGDQDETSYALDRLEFGKTYCWRIDEVNDLNSNSPWEGNVWSFTVEPLVRPIPGDSIVATANSNDPGQGPESTINGIGLADNDLHSQDITEMWLSAISEPGAAWIQYSFDKAYKLDRVLVWNHNGQAENFVGFGIKDALIEFSIDGIQWTFLGVIELARATVTPLTKVDLQGIAAKFARITAHSNWGGIFKQYGLSEVRFSFIPLSARQPQPASGQTGVSPDVTLTWTAGREAALHDVYVGTDPSTLPLVETVNENGFSTLPLDLQLDQTYYWRIDEVNDAEVPSTWAGDTWNFTTDAVILIDDMESYSNEDDRRIFDAWVDGFSDSSNNGALVGANPSGDDFSPESEIVRTGGQSLPFHYDNTSGAAFSEAVRTLAPAQDWTRAGVQGLVVYFYGDSENVPGQLFVRVNNTKVLYDGDMGTLQRVAWQKWYIPLADHLTNNELAAVRSMGIGIEGSGQGVLLVDDISLTANSRSLIVPVEPTPDNLVAHYAFDGDASDNTGAHPGTVMGLSIFEAGKVGQAIRLAGVIGDSVELTGYNRDPG